MPYAYIQDVPANEHIYAQVKDRLGDEPPKGLTAHLAVRREGRLRYVDVWETQADWARFREDRLDPAVRDVLAGMGIPFDGSQVRFEEIDVIDT